MCQNSQEAIYHQTKYLYTHGKKALSKLCLSELRAEFSVIHVSFPVAIGSKNFTIEFR